MELTGRFLAAVPVAGLGEASEPSRRQKGYQLPAKSSSQTHKYKQAMTVVCIRSRPDDTFGRRLRTATDEEFISGTRPDAGTIGQLFVRCIFSPAAYRR
jgi:hypothetical protein